MTGKPSEAQLHAFFDGQLDDREEAEVLAYLDGHPEALHRFRNHDARRHQLAAGLEQLGEAEIDPATEALASRLADRMHRRERSVRLRRWFTVGAGVMALTVAGWTGHIAYVEAVDDRMPALLADAARDHVLFTGADKPVEIAGGDQQLMARIFSAHLGETVTIPDLRTYGYELIGGRLLGAAEGPFVQLRYDDGDNHPLTLYLAKYGAPVEGTHFAEVGGLGAGYWQQEALSYAVIADAPLTEVERIASALSQAP